MNKLYALIIGFVLSISSSVYFTSEYKDGQYAKEKVNILKVENEKLDKQKKDYEKKLKDLSELAAKKQLELNTLNSTLETKNVEANKKINATLDKYNRLVRDGWRLRDPGTSVQLPSSTEGSVSRPSDGSNPRTSGGELSAEASQFLLEFATDADKVVEQLRTTQEYAKKLKQICEKQ